MGSCFPLPCICLCGHIIMRGLQLLPPQGSGQVTFPWGSNPLQPFLGAKRHVHQQKEGLHGGCCLWWNWDRQQRALSAALLRQKDREILVWVVALESGVIATVQASWGKGSAGWAQGWVGEFP